MGKSGGILCGFKYDSLEVQNVKLGKHMILVLCGTKLKSVGGLVWWCMDLLMRNSNLTSLLNLPPFVMRLIVPILLVVTLIS